MDKITLEQLAPYLPYGLKALIKNKIVEVTKICKTSIETLPSIRGFTFCSYNDFKPILRPLSDLTKEIEHNGERFVPMVELYKIARGRFKDSTVRYHSPMSTTSIIVEMEGHRNYIFSFVRSDADVRLGQCYSFQLHSTDLLSENPKSEMVQCWNLLFKKLYEWMFDLEDLIASGLAVDINTLKNG